jgi:hypothetical protein
MAEYTLAELALRIAVLALILAISVAALFLAYVYGPPLRSASDANSSRCDGKASHASNTGPPGLQASPDEPERDASHTPTEGETS